MTEWTQQTPLKVGLHPPMQCARGRTDCRSLAQIVSSDAQTFVCCGELRDAEPEPKDKWAFCIRGDQSRDYCTGTDLRIFVDHIDIADMAAVLSMAAATAMPRETTPIVARLDGRSGKSAEEAGTQNAKYRLKERGEL